MSLPGQFTDSYTGATLAPLQCMHSVHCSVYPVYTLTDTGIGSGLASCFESVLVTPFKQNSHIKPQLLNLLYWVPVLYSPIWMDQASRGSHIVRYIQWITQSTSDGPNTEIPFMSIEHHKCPVMAFYQSLSMFSSLYPCIMEWVMCHKRYTVSLSFSCRKKAKRRAKKPFLLL